MKLLEDRIRSEGKILPGDIIKVDGFLNHRVDVSLLRECAKEFGRLFDTSKITCVVTIEASGIPIATVCAEEFGVPLIYAKKAKSDNISGDVYTSDIRSYTYNKPVKLTLSKEWLTKGDKVLVIDDFMANGQALSGLIDIIEQAGAELVGIGIAIEKGFQPGGAELRAKGYDLKSLAIIDKADENGFVFRPQE